MYQVSNAFLNAMKSPVQEHTITGTIGSVSFSEENIVDGSFSISNQSTDTSDVVLGSCYVGQLTAEFVGINIAYGKWINKTITPSFGLKVGEYYEYVPLGVYKVKEAKHTDHGVQVTAYDNMIKFDKKFRKSHFMNLSGMTNIIDQLCTDAGVVCGMSHAQIEALPNGDRTGINIYGSTGKKAEFANDITTLRDLLFWVAQTLGCFATMNRAGQLEFRQYTQDVVDNISNVHRIEGATFADYITHYVGIYVENLDDNTEDYYGYDTTALQQELTETMAEITEDQEDITDLELDRADWVQKLANHECTQQEYDAAIVEIDAQEKALTKEINQLSKRAEWLSNAIAQSADDGSDMVLGANPLVMAKNLTTRDSQRREILCALNAISYTPFQASVVCGCIYDLGDVIQFSGGLYNSDTDSFGCVMSYTYTHNGGTELEGFGVDPSVVVIRNKTQKSTDRAQKNSINAKENYNGTVSPQEAFPNDSAKDGDIYVKTKTVRRDAHPLDLADVHYYNYDVFMNSVEHIQSVSRCVEVKSAVWEENGYHIKAQGPTFKLGGMNLNSGSPVIKIPVTQSGKYTFHGKFKYSAMDNRINGGTIGITFVYDAGDYFGGTPVGTFERASWGGGNLNLDMDEDTWEEHSDWFNVPATWAQAGYFYVSIRKDGADPRQYNVDGSLSVEIKEFYITYEGDSESDLHEPKIEEVYNYVVDENTNEGKWLKVDNTSLAGLSDILINNPANDQILRWNADSQAWTNQTLNLDFSKVIANPSETTANNLTKVSIDGSVYNVAGGGSDVEANPSGAATDDLVKIGIDGDVYSVKDSNAYHTGDLAEVALTGSYSDLQGVPVIPTKTSDLLNDNGFVESSDLAEVATSGSYNDLSNKPTIPAAQVNSDWNASSGVAEILNKPTIPTTTDDLTDIDVASPQTGQLLKYDAVAGKWKNAYGTNSYEIIEVTWLEYLALTPEQKADPLKEYMIKDYPADGESALVGYEVTQAQYEALTPEQKSNPYCVFFIKDYN